jgi:endonuclease/exonuclease/phosphatase family metal-dependent hydrolase
VRIGTWNVLHGMALPEGRCDPDAFSEAVARTRADVLALQEIDVAQPRSGLVDQPALAAAALGVEHWHFAPALFGTPGETWTPATQDVLPDDGTPGYGVALVSRYPLTSVRVIRLGQAAVRAPLLNPSTRRLMMIEDEPRVAISAVVQTPTGPLLVAATHLSFVPGVNARQLRRLTRVLDDQRADHETQVLLGDLNLPRPFHRVVRGWRTLARAATYPSWRPRVQFDHILSRGPAPIASALETPAVAVSDHRPLVVHLRRAHD